MKRQIVLKSVVAAGLIALGWTAGQAAQTSRADFELHVSSPSGTTTIMCVRGCGMQFIRTAPDRAAAEPSFTYTCGNPNGGQCGGAVQGWVIR